MPEGRAVLNKVHRWANLCGGTLLHHILFMLVFSAPNNRRLKCNVYLNKFYALYNSCLKNRPTL